MAEYAKKALEFADLIGIAVGAGLGYLGGPIGAVSGAAGGYFVAKELSKKTSAPHTHSPQANYQQTSSFEMPRRFGKPLTEEERRARHYAIYGTTEAPPRGTGLTRAKYERV